jgi:predicted O-methyltransferase YrrM
MVLKLEDINKTNTEFYQKYFLNMKNDHHLVRMPGEWYKFLTYLTNLYNDITILDVGTCWGESAIALSQNKSNKVITYDIHTLWEKEFNPNRRDFLQDFDNLEMRVTDIKNESDNLIKSAKIIVFDIAHDGIQEKNFTDRLERIGYKGYVICDDIFSPWYPKMKPWWNSITTEKYDITDLAHNSGTGLINYYEDKNITIIR